MEGGIRRRYRQPDCHANELQGVGPEGRVQAARRRVAANKFTALFIAPGGLSLPCPPSVVRIRICGNFCRGESGLGIYIYRENLRIIVVALGVRGCLLVSRNKSY